MPNKSGLSGLTTAGAIVFSAAGWSGTATTKNNIIRIAQPGGFGILKYNNAGGTVVSNYNNIVALGGASTGRLGSTVYPTLTDWQGAGYDVNGQNVDPTATTPGAWVSATDLHFTGGYADQLGSVPRITGVVDNDIDGDSRIEWTWPGCR